MSERAAGGAVPLWVLAVVFAALVGLLVWFRAPTAAPLRLGALAPDFALPALDGSTVSLASQRGRVVFVNFWATWCPPCREEAPALQRLADRLDPDSFALLAISIDSAGAEPEIEAFRREFGVGFPILLDPGQGAHRLFGVTGVPESYLIDPQGQVVEVFIGPRDWDQPRYLRAIERLIPKRGGDDG